MVSALPRDREGSDHTAFCIGRRLLRGSQQACLKKISPEDPEYYKVAGTQCLGHLVTGGSAPCAPPLLKATGCMDLVTAYLAVHEVPRKDLKGVPGLAGLPLTGTDPRSTCLV